VRGPEGHAERRIVLSPVHRVPDSRPHTTHVDRRPGAVRRPQRRAVGADAGGGKIPGNRERCNHAGVRRVEPTDRTRSVRAGRVRREPAARRKAATSTSARPSTSFERRAVECRRLEEAVSCRQHVNRGERPSVVFRRRRPRFLTRPRTARLAAGIPRSCRPSRGFDCISSHSERGLKSILDTFNAVRYQGLLPRAAPTLEAMLALERFAP
jgi:hypothetical protein